MSAPDPNIRISNTQREALIGRLQAATEEGLLDLDEFAERSRQAYEAKTYADVSRLLADLPDDDRALTLPDRGSGAGGATPALDLKPVHSRVKRAGSWTVPARITTKEKHSSVTLDCRHAKFASQDIEVHADLTHSALKLILPKNASAVEDDVELYGGKVVNHCQHQKDGPRFHINGSTRWSRISIRYERRFLWWRW